MSQINIGTDDLNDALVANRIDIDATTVALTIPSELPTKMNLLTGETSDETTASVTFTCVGVPSSDEGYYPYKPDQYKYLAMNYVLAPEENTTLDDAVTLSLTNSTTNAISMNINNFSIQRNYRSNVYGSLLTSEVGISVKINPLETCDYIYRRDRFYRAVHDEEEFLEARHTESRLALMADMTFTDTLCMRLATDIYLNSHTMTTNGNVSFGNFSAHKQTGGLTYKEPVDSVEIVGGTWNAIGGRSKMFIVKENEDVTGEMNGKILFKDVTIASTTNTLNIIGCSSMDVINSELIGHTCSALILTDNDSSTYGFTTVGATLNITNSKLYEADTYGSHVLNIAAQYATVNINNSEITSESNSKYADAINYSGIDGTMTINNSTISTYTEDNVNSGIDWSNSSNTEGGAHLTMNNTSVYGSYNALSICYVNIEANDCSFTTDTSRYNTCVLLGTISNDFNYSAVMNRCTISNSKGYGIYNGYTDLTLNDCTATCGRSSIDHQNGLLTINGGTYENTNTSSVSLVDGYSWGIEAESSGGIVCNGATISGPVAIRKYRGDLTLTDCTIIGTKRSGVMTRRLSEDATTNIINCDISGTSYAVEQYEDYNGYRDQLNIYSGTFTASTPIYIFYSYDTEVNIYGGTFYSNGYQGMYFYRDSNIKLNIYGGDFYHDCGSQTSASLFYLHSIYSYGDDATADDCGVYNIMGGNFYMYGGSTTSSSVFPTSIIQTLYYNHVNIKSADDGTHPNFYFSDIDLSISLIFVNGSINTIYLEDPSWVHVDDETCTSATRYLLYKYYTSLTDNYYTIGDNDMVEMEEGRTWIEM